MFCGYKTVRQTGLFCTGSAQVTLENNMTPMPWKTIEPTLIKDKWATGFLWVSFYEPFSPKICKYGCTEKNNKHEQLLICNKHTLSKYFIEIGGTACTTGKRVKHKCSGEPLHCILSLTSHSGSSSGRRHAQTHHPDQQQ